MNKKFGLPTAISICVGMVLGSSMMITISAGFGYSGLWFVLPMIVACVLNMILAISDTYLYHKMPGIRGGTGQYLYVGMGPAVSITSQITANLLASMFALTVEATMCGTVLHEMFPAISIPIFTIVIILFMMLANLYGVKVFAKIQLLTVMILFVTIFVMGFIGFFRLGIGTPIDVASETPPLVGGSSFYMTSIAFWVFLGIDAIIPLSSNLKNANKNVFKSMCIALVALFIIDSMLGIGFLHYVSIEDLMTSNIPHMIYAEAILGKFGCIWMEIAIILAGVTTINSSMMGVSAVLAGMADNNLVPKFFTKENKYGTAYISIVLVTTVQVVLVLLGLANSLTLFISVASCCTIIAQFLIHLTVVKLRYKYPDKSKKYEKFQSIIQVIGIIGYIYILLNVSDVPSEKHIIWILCAVLMFAIGIYAVLWSKFIMKMAPFKSVPIKTVLKGQNERLTEPEDKAEETISSGNIITISREFGSMGRPIARIVAKKMGYKLYDPQLVEETARRLNADVDELKSMDEQNDMFVQLRGSKFNSMAYPLGWGDASKRRKLFEEQKQLILEIAKKENAVIVGRAADYILTEAGKKNLLRIHIIAPYEYRIKESVNELQLTVSDAKEHIKIIDNARNEFYEKVTGVQFSSSKYRDVIVNSSAFDEMEDVANIICDMAKKKFRINKK